jgi:hypothetical protein
LTLRIGQRFPFPWPPAEALLEALLDDLGLSRPAPKQSRRGRSSRR